MEKYEPLGVVGEGSYGIVLKCKSRSDGGIVAIKKFIDSEDDLNVRKIAVREIRVLKKLRHENLVNLLEVFRRRKHLYLVFEFIDSTLLEQLEQTSHGLNEETCRKYIFQILRGLGFCHDNSVIHRDIKPENVLVSNSGIVKLCDFGFARNICGPGDIYTGYVATRWYRSPELLVGDVGYGKEVDIWAVGCLFAEMSTGEPLFPGDSDIDQLFLIAQRLGRLSKRHLSLMSKNSAFKGFQFPKSRHGSTTSMGSNKGSRKGLEGGSIPATTSFSSHMHNSGRRRKSSTSPPSSVFAAMFPSWTDESVYFLTVCLDPEPTGRPTCTSLMRMPYFTQDNFPNRFLHELNSILQSEGYLTIGNTVRKRRNLVAPVGLGGANVSPAIAGGTKQTSKTTFLAVNSLSTSDEPQRVQPFQSNNLANQNQFIPTSNLARQHTFVVAPIIGGKEPPRGRKGGGNESRIPISLTRKSSDEAMGSGSKSEESPDGEKSPIIHPTSSSQDKRFSVSQTPKKFSFGVPQGVVEELGTKSEIPMTQTVPVTTLTFNLGSHNMSYNGNSYVTSNVPTPVRLKSPISVQSTNPFHIGNPNLRRSSPARIRKKVGTNATFNGVVNNTGNTKVFGGILGSSFGGMKSHYNPWSTANNNEEHFLPRMTPKQYTTGIQFQIPNNGVGTNVTTDENNPNLFPSLGNPSNRGANGGIKKKGDQQLHLFQPSRRPSVTNDLGNIKPFLVNTNSNGETYLVQSEIGKPHALPYMQ